MNGNQPRTVLVVVIRTKDYTPEIGRNPELAMCLPDVNKINVHVPQQYEDMDLPPVIVVHTEHPESITTIDLCIEETLKSMAPKSYIFDISVPLMNEIPYTNHKSKGPPRLTRDQIRRRR